MLTGIGIESKLRNALSMIQALRSAQEQSRRLGRNAVVSVIYAAAYADTLENIISQLEELREGPWLCGIPDPDAPINKRAPVEQKPAQKEKPAEDCVPKRCDTCEHWKADALNIKLKEGYRGVCRRYPPHKQGFPGIYNHALCGEYMMAKCFCGMTRDGVHFVQPDGYARRETRAGAGVKIVTL